MFRDVLTGRLSCIKFRFDVLFFSLSCVPLKRHCYLERTARTVTTFECEQITGGAGELFFYRWQACSFASHMLLSVLDVFCECLSMMRIRIIVYTVVVCAAGCDCFM